MNPVKYYSLVDVDAEQCQARLARDGQVVGRPVRGALLEAQFGLGDGSALLWLTDDSPYDEGLHVYLLDQAGECVDALDAGWDFTPGVLSIDRFGDDWLEFRFFKNETTYRLEIRPQPRVRLRLPLGWRYQHWLRGHRLIVSTTT